MVGIIAVLALLLVGLAGYLVAVLRQVEAITAQLGRRREGITHAPVALDLVSPSLNRLAALVNETIADAEDAALAARRHEAGFRELIAEISHDLRTPLTAIRGYQRLLAATDLDAEQRAQLAVAARHANELAEQVDGLFEYAYLLDSHTQTTRGLFDLGALVGECLVAALESLESRGLRVDYRHKEQILIESDRQKVTRIVENLVRNAAQYAVGHLTVSVDADDHVVRLIMTNDVADPSRLEVTRVFERFYSERDFGTGLGLTIVSLLTRKLGGSVGADLDGGEFRVCVTLPRRVSGETGDATGSRTDER
ncbi:HAMP domain-containing sensor histidine kinase [Brooklawnia cerclae]|uniref:histidine kinase n=1 Tax=Brooklawnia cerclae TaxID=349934 RepID=A0ABX0SDX7_9ACTN|nr:HAMP domain-containing sensor histidine kinase [Brooklawnia cerclae]NIH56559.1 signal transduction histidine kinase [Brooklawnia cerclae]